MFGNCYQVNCNFSHSSHSLCQCLTTLLVHIKAYHPVLYDKLLKRARKLAQSQNGCGYFDYGTDNSGWPNAQQTFRDAWTETALKEMLNA